MSNSAIAKHYTRILSRWPKDLLRPDKPFTKMIERRAAPFGVKPLEPTSKHVSSSSTTDGVAPPNTKAELAQVNALYSLLENRYSRRYPVSQNLFHPSSDPEYYYKLIAEIEEAPNKSWLESQFDYLRNKIRWQ